MRPREVQKGSRGRDYEKLAIFGSVRALVLPVSRAAARSFRAYVLFDLVFLDILCYLLTQLIMTLFSSSRQLSAPLYRSYAPKREWPTAFRPDPRAWVEYDILYYNILQHTMIYYNIL